MIGAIARGWHKAQALSVLQLAFKLPLKEPLDRETNAILIHCSKVVMAEKGTPHDTAVSFAIDRAHAAADAGDVETCQKYRGLAKLFATLLRNDLKLHERHATALKLLDNRMNLLSRAGRS